MNYMEETKRELKFMDDIKEKWRVLFKNKNETS